MKREKGINGITLIALIVTIIILLILSGVTIATLFGENGILTKAQRAEEMQLKANEQERLELVKIGVEAENQGKVTITDYINELINKGITSEDDIESNAEDGSKQIITDTGYNVNISKDPNNENNIIITVEGKGKNLSPKIIDLQLTSSTNSITARVATKRVEKAEYYYYYKTEEDENYTLAHKGKETTYEINPLKQDTTYTIKVKVENKNGRDEKIAIARTGELPTAVGAITFTNGKWENGRHSVTITKTTTDSYSMEYQVINSEGTVIISYTNITSGGTIPNLNHGDIITARLTDGTNSGKTATYNVKDNIKPTVTITKGTITSNSIQVNVTAIDNESGIAETPNYKYYIKETGVSTYPAKPITDNIPNHTFEGLTHNKEYDIKVEIEDRAENVGATELLAVKTTEVTSGTGAITFTNPTWSGGKHSVTITKTTIDSYSMEYQVTNSTGVVTVTYKAITSGEKIANLNHGDIITARLTDGRNTGNTTTYNVKDNIKPTVTVTKGTVTYDSMQINATAIDNQTGMEINPSYKYYIKESTQTEYQKSAQTNNKFTDLKQNTNYDIKVEVADKAGNIGIGYLTGVSITVTGWEQKQDGKISDGIVEVNIGDYINYNCISSTYTTQYTSASSKNGYEDQSFNASNYKYGWRILGVNSSKQLMLISENEIGRFSLKGKNGYVNGISELNNICNIYGRGTGASTARCITVDDVNKITGYNPRNVGVRDEKQVGNGIPYGVNTSYEYGTNTIYTLTSSGVKYETSNNRGNGTSSYTKFTYYDETNKVWKDLATNGNKTVENNYYKYYPTTLKDEDNSNATIGIGNNTKEYSTIFGKTGTDFYWLASKCTYNKNGSVEYGLRTVGINSTLMGDDNYVRLASMNFREQNSINVAWVARTRWGICIKSKAILLIWG